jgi:hypothetical protein
VDYAVIEDTGSTDGTRGSSAELETKARLERDVTSLRVLKANGGSGQKPTLPPAAQSPDNRISSSLEGARGGSA